MMSEFSVNWLFIMHARIATYQFVERTNKFGDIALNE